MNSIKIISDGTPHGTKVINEKTGHEIEGVAKIEFEPFDVNSELLTAKLTFICVELEVKAAWDQSNLQQWANKKVGK